MYPEVKCNYFKLKVITNNLIHERLISRISFPMGSLRATGLVMYFHATSLH